MTESEHEGGGYRTAADCVDAGMYWFRACDLGAAEAWWRRALELEPENQRALECLKLLSKTSSTGYKQDSWASMPAVNRGSGRPPPGGPSPEAARAAPRPEAAADPSNPFADRSDPFADRSSSSSPAPVVALFSPDVASDGESDRGAAPLDPAGFGGGAAREDAPESPVLGGMEKESAGPSTDLLRFVNASEQAASESEGPTHDLDAGSLAMPARSVRTPASDPSAAVEMAFAFEDAADSGPDAASSREAAPDSDVAPAPAVSGPWDVGPSRTSVITVASSGEFDAVADPTPLPEVDRERFFNRGDPSSKAEIFEYLRATGDLSESDEDLAELVSDPEDEAPSSIADAVLTEPALQVPTSAASDILQVARDKYQLDDFQGVVEALEGAELEGTQQTELRNMLASARSKLMRSYEAKLGSMEVVPRVTVSSEQIIWLNLNHRAGFILSQVDGMVSYDDLVSLSGMTRLDTVRILAELVEQGVIGAG